MPTSPPDPPDEDDPQLFRHSVGLVRPLTHVPPPISRVKPEPHLRSRATAVITVHESAAPYLDPAWLTADSALSYLREGYSSKLLRQLERGQIAIQDDLDLHRMHARTAQSRITGFLAAAMQHRLQCVRIVHGKGLRSRASGPVLKVLTDHLLRQHDMVIAFASASAAEGGTGAVIVLLQTVSD